MKMIKDDNYFMSLALKEAKKAYLEGEIPVGCVIVLDDKIIARAHNKREKLRECIIKWLKSKKPLFPPPNEPEQQSGKVRIISQQVADNGRTKENQRSIDKELSSDEELSSALGNMLKRMSKETLMRKLAEASYNLSKSIELEHEQENRR